MLASFAGLAVSVTVSWALVGSLGIVAIPVAYAAATGTKSALMAIALAARIRTMEPAPVEVDPASYARQPALSGLALPTDAVGRTAMKLPSRPG